MLIIERARSEYARILRIKPGTAERHYNHAYMCFLRGLIAELEGRDEETVQTEYERAAWDDIYRATFGATAAESRLPSKGRKPMNDQKPPKTWLEMADLLIRCSRGAQADGDTVLSLALAVKAAECLKIHKLLDIKIGEVCASVSPAKEGSRR